MESQFYIKSNSDSVECQLCPHRCRIKENRLGICGTRLNQNSTLESILWGVIASSSLDPIEKKPLYHFFPGKMIYSVGGYGCNLKCIFCQNFEISQFIPQNIDVLRIVSPSEVVQKAKLLANNIGIAFTYNEPIISFEYMLEIANLSKQEDLKNVMVSNGFINSKPLSVLFDSIDAFNIDLKAFTDNFYQKYTGGSLEPILKTLKSIRESGKHLEITFLVIPNLNDNEEDAKSMFDWISKELGENTVLHLSRYHPAHLLETPPTPTESLIKLYRLAKNKLQYVYLGNTQSIEIGNNTSCPKCKSIVIKRSGYNAAPIGIDKKGNCFNCGFGPIIINS
jgi:pyruvate formate lyase activating enzyme